MATYYSDLFGAQPDLTTPRAGYRAKTGTRNMSKQVTRVTLGTGVLDGDVVVMLPVHYNDRLIELSLTEISSFNSATSISVDVGLYTLTGYCALGPVLDLDLFASAVSVKAAALARLDEMLESGSLVNLDRGKTFYDLFDITSTPTAAQKTHQWAICLHFNIVGAVSAGGEILMETTILRRA